MRGNYRVVLFIGQLHLDSKGVVLIEHATFDDARATMDQEAERLIAEGKAYSLSLQKWNGERFVSVSSRSRFS